MAYHDYELDQERVAHAGTSGQFWAAIAREEHLENILKAEIRTGHRNFELLMDAGDAARDEASEMRHAALRSACRAEGARRTLLRVQTGEVAPDGAMVEFDRQMQAGDFADVEAQLLQQHGKHPELAIAKHELRPAKPDKLERPEVPYPESKAPQAQKSFWAKLFGK